MIPTRSLLLWLALLPGTAFASPMLGLYGELPTIHSPMARFSGEQVEHSLPISVGARAELGFDLEQARWLVVDLGLRRSGLDLGTMDHAMLDLAFRRSLADREALHPYWEAGLGVELIRLHEPEEGDLALHVGPRFLGGLGLELGSHRLRPTVGARASFTAATGSFDLPDVVLDDQTVQRFYMPSALVLAGTIGVSFR